MKSYAGIRFIIMGLLALFLGALMGLIGSIQFVSPSWMDILPFIKSRPLHVSLVVSWIFFVSIGGIYHYLTHYSGSPLRYPALPSWHLGLMLATGSLILISYITGTFGGREYWEFPPWLAIPLILSWLMFLVNYFRTIGFSAAKWPVYYWMWATGIVFFLFTIIESYLWLFPWFGNNVLRDLTIQWKAYGALVGSWNMLVYGTAIFIMEKSLGNDRLSRSSLAYAMFFLGFVNLLFGWGHHIYPLPVVKWIRILAYAISMTELIILARLIYNWRAGLKISGELKGLLYAKFLGAADQWIVLNLVLAILISIPAVNIFTHGTHITVAHAMGSTIGINSMILLASVFFIILGAGVVISPFSKRLIILGFWITNISLFFFWIFLILAGIGKGFGMTGDHLDFRVVMERITPYMKSFAVSGAFLLTGLGLIIFPVINILLRLTDETVRVQHPKKGSDE